MLKKTITYEDFNGETVSEDFYFHLSKAELIELEMSHTGGLQEALRRIVAAEDGAAIIAEFKKIILGAYGQKSHDGRRFIKTQQLRDEFESTEAYSTLFMELVTDADAAAKFVNGIMPKNLAEEVAKVTALAAVPDPTPLETAVNVLEITREQLMVMPKEEFENMQTKIASGEVKLIP